MSYRAIVWKLRRRPEGDPCRAILDELRERITSEPPDASTLEALVAELARRGVVLPGMPPAWSPGPGEAYVLLVSAAGGSVGRLRVERAGAPYGVSASEGVGERALGQARVALHALAERLAATGGGVPNVGAAGHELRVVSEGGEVDGSSLGAAFAAAAVSRWTGVAPAPDVAATAAVDALGTLVPVQGIEAKLHALARAYPAVRRVVVAAEQEPREPELSGIALVRCAALDEALVELGLSLDAVRGSVIATAHAEARIRALASAQVEDYSAERWRERALEARMLAAHPHIEPSDATTATAFAALFHLHANDGGDAQALASSLKGERVEELSAVMRAWVGIIQATSAIDAGRVEDAIERASRAAALARTLGRHEQREVLGRAVGTLGRARMHAGDEALALPLLREAAEHHEAVLRREAARSWITLATGLRRVARHDEALEALERARSAIDAQPSERESASSRLFLSYERGRVLFELGRHDEALACFEQVVRAQPRAHDYPRIGCLRYMATIALACGDGRAREWLVQALEVAETARGPIGTVAATAAMALLEGSLADLRPRAEAAWSRCTGTELGSESVERVLRELVY